MSYLDNSDRPTLVTNVNPGNAKRAEKLMRRIESELVQACKPLVQHMYSSTDDLFYELSKRASSNNEQNLYFESMREIRIKKMALTQGFIDGIKENFTSLEYSEKPHLESNNLPQKNGQNLAIVDSDELEIDIAAKNMADRTSELFKQEIHALTIRLDHLFPHRGLTTQTMPLAPQLISKAFVNACFTFLNLNTKARLILFKVFEKQVLKQLDKAFSFANQHLIEAGILPKLPKTIKKQHTSESASSSTQIASGESRHPLNRDTTISLSPEMFTRLMSAIKSSANAGVHYHIYCTNPGPLLPLSQLTSSLSKKQPLIDKKIARTRPQNYLHTLVSDLLGKDNPQQPKALQQYEEQTINLVAMFFDKLLADKQLPLIAQSLICRLQIPLLKLALNDKSFFKNPSHPARNLINNITTASAQLDSSKSLERDPLYRLIVDGIQTINHQYAIYADSFTALSEQITQQLVREQRKSEIVEKRTEQTELGKAKIKAAKAYAQSAVFEKVKTQQLPPTIFDFLIDAWLQVLVLTYLKEGKDNLQWTEAEQLMSDIIWLSKPHNDERSKARALRLTPDALLRVENGLNAAFGDQTLKQQLLNSVKATIQQAIESPEHLNLQLMNQDQLNKLDRDKDSMRPRWETKQDVTDSVDQNAELGSEYFALAQNLIEGTWLECSDEEDKPLLCKLSKKIDADTYIFVNRFGIKNLEKSRRELALDLQKDKAKILDITPVFDRVMEDLLTEYQLNAA